MRTHFEAVSLRERYCIMYTGIHPESWKLKLLGMPSIHRQMSHLRSSLPIELMVMPLPKPDTLPPTTAMYFIPPAQSLL